MEENAAKTVSFLAILAYFLAFFANFATIKIFFSEI